MDGPKDLGFYLQDFSPVDLPVIIPEQRDMGRERRAFSQYLSSLEKNWQDLIESLSAQQPYMSPSVRVVVFVPARLEGQRIGGLLRALNAELGELAFCDPPFLELFVLNNWRFGESRDETYEVIESHRAKRNSRFPILYFEHVWAPNEERSMALARKLLVDVALYRALRRPKADGPLFLITEDADVEHIGVVRLW